MALSPEEQAIVSRRLVELTREAEALSRRIGALTGVIEEQPPSDGPPPPGG